MGDGVMKVFIVPFHVKRMDESIMPPELAGAYVSCYASGRDYSEATERCLKRLVADGLHPIEILQPINEMKLEDWERHIKEVWSGYAASLPSQQEFEDAIKKDAVVYGPFGSYE